MLLVYWTVCILQAMLRHVGRVVGVGFAYGSVAACSIGRLECRRLNPTLGLLAFVATARALACAGHYSMPLQAVCVPSTYILQLA